MSVHSWDFVRHEQILFGQCLITNCYLQPWEYMNKATVSLAMLHSVLWYGFSHQWEEVLPKDHEANNSCIVLTAFTFVFTENFYSKHPHQKNQAGVSHFDYR